MFPLVLLSQIYKPSIKWFVINREKMDFANYCRNTMYYIKGVPSISSFKKIIENEKTLLLFQYNTFYEIDNMITNAQEKIKLPFSQTRESLTNIFFTKIIMPGSLGKVVHSREVIYKSVVENLGYNLMLQYTHKIITLDDFIRGK